MDRLNLADYNIEQNKVETEKIQQVLDEAKILKLWMHPVGGCLSMHARIFKYGTS